MRDIEERCKAEELAFGQARRRKYLKRGKELIVRDLVTALVLCHNVTPVEDRGVKLYQASSPDEVALVKFAETINMKLINRDFNSITIENSNSVEEKYLILACFPFTSDTKRMGIILKHVATNRIIFYLKGADSIMKFKVPEVQRGFLMDECESLAREGLRTLVISQKFLTKREYEEWQKIYDEAQNSMVNREENVKKAIESLEVDMEFLGITGVEDKLQEDI